MGVRPWRGGWERAGSVAAGGSTNENQSSMPQIIAVRDAWMSTPFFRNKWRVIVMAGVACARSVRGGVCGVRSWEWGGGA